MSFVAAPRCRLKSGYSLLILSDRGVDKDYAPIPCLLALAAVHNVLLRRKRERRLALIIESGEAAGSDAFCPARRLWSERDQPVSGD